MKYLILSAGAYFLLFCAGSWAQDTPYQTGFENSEGFTANDYSSGNIDSAGKWAVEEGSISVQTSKTYEQDQALEVSPSAKVNASLSGGSADVIWIQAAYQAAPQGADPDVSTLGLESTALLYFNDSEGIKVYDGTTSEWKSIGVITLSSQWYLIALKIDFNTHTWDIYVDSQLKESDIGFKDNTVDSFSGFRCGSGSEGSGYLDEFYLNTVAPDNITPPATETPTATSTATSTFTFTPTSTSTSTPTNTFTFTPTFTYTPTFTPSPTNTPLNETAFVDICLPQEGPAGMFSFIASATDEDGTIVSYEWDLPGSDNEMAQYSWTQSTITSSTSRTYLTPGLFDVVFKVWDDDGQLASATSSVKIWTPLPTESPTPTESPAPTESPMPSATPTVSLTPTESATPTVPPVPGDVNNDKMIDRNDIFDFSVLWHNQAPGIQQNKVDPGTVNPNDDDTIDEKDLLLLIKEWRK